MSKKSPNIQIIEKLKIDLDQLLPFEKKNQDRLNKKIRIEFNYNSNHLEGNTLTYGQTQLVLFFDKIIGDAPISDIEEMKAHDVALTQIIEMAKDFERPLTESFIQELNEIILVKPFWKDAVTSDGIPTRKKIEIGKYKTTPNSVQLKNGSIHEYATPIETPALMCDLLTWYHDKSQVLHPVHLAAEFHYKFVCIHPFDDGNGRVARLLMNYILIKNDYPLVIIKAEDKNNYLTALQKADAGDLSSIIEYIEKQSISSLELSLKAGRGESIDEFGDLEKQIEILKREKLSKTKIFKTPKVSYELIKHIDTEFWNPIDNMLEKFSDFFAETANELQIDNKVYKKSVSSRRLGMSQFSEILELKNKPYEIFGHVIELNEIQSITWSKKMFSLKSVSKKMDYIFSCQLSLNQSGYELKIYESNANGDGILKNNTVLFEIENEYKSFFMNDIISSIVQEISTHLISIIQNEK